jgi:putative glutamine amidotransferase
VKPLIGLTSELIEQFDRRDWNAAHLLTHYTEAVAAAGGIPLILPLAQATDVEATLERLDGLVLTGSVPDVPAEALGQEQHPTTKEAMPMARWESEKVWLEAAREINLPILGICAGMQVMAITAGSDIIQDLPSQWDNPQQHAGPDRMYRHDVSIEPKTRLAELAPSDTVNIISAHHQAVCDVPTPYRLAASAADGVIEAIEDPGKSFCIGVQWHPERPLDQPDWLITAFINACTD